jgi:hypothetical protein
VEKVKERRQIMSRNAKILIKLCAKKNQNMRQAPVPKAKKKKASVPKPFSAFLQKLKKLSCQQIMFAWSVLNNQIL